MCRNSKSSKFLRVDGNSGPNAAPGNFIILGGCPLWGKCALTNVSNCSLLVGKLQTSNPVMSCSWSSCGQVSCLSRIIQPVQQFENRMQCLHLLDLNCKFLPRDMPELLLLAMGTGAAGDPLVLQRGCSKCHVHFVSQNWGTNGPSRIGHSIFNTI